jgi:endonuclease/exonuclease/phosphatase family metal-dependent hydrolase
MSTTKLVNRQTVGLLLAAGCASWSIGCAKTVKHIHINPCVSATALAIPVAEVQQVRLVPISTQDRRELDYWENAVGSPVVWPAPECANPLPPSDSLLVVSWNVHVGHGDLDSLVDDIRGARFIVGDSIQHFVLLIQEAFRRGDDVPVLTSKHGLTRCPNAIKPGIDITNQATELGLALFYVPSMRNSKCKRFSAPEDRGNAILSTLPLSEFTTIELAKGRQRRVVALASVNGVNTRGRDWTLRLASIHFDTGDEGLLGWSPYHGVRARNRQATHLAQALGCPRFGVAAGDLNSTIPGFDRAKHRLGKVFPASDHPDGATYGEYLPYVDFLLGFHLDYMFVRAGTTHSYAHSGRLYGSDHSPIYGWIKFNEPAPDCTVTTSQG